MKSSSLDKCEHSVAAALAASFALDGHIDCPAHSNMPRSLLWSPVPKRWLRLRPAGSPEAPLSAGPCLRLPGASGSLGQSAAWAALAGHIGLVFHIGAVQRMRTVTRSQDLASVFSCAQEED